MRQDFQLASIKTLLSSPELLEEQKKVLKRFDQEADMNENLAVATRYSQLYNICRLAKAVKKPFREITREDVENFLYSLELSPGTMNLYKIQIKKFFKWLYQSKDYPPIVEWIKTTNHKKRKLPEELLTPIEIRAMVDAMDSLRDRALISILYESGCRLSEVVRLKQKNVVIDQYGATILVDGKTGQRRIRLIDSSPDLLLWLNNHPRKGPEKPLWTNHQFPEKALEERGLQYLVKFAAKRAGIEKNVFTHLLRHSRFTRLAEDFSESDLKVMGGWSGDSRMTGVYVHRSGADIDKKRLKLAGLLEEEVSKKDEVLKPRICPRCKESNPSTALFCYKCGAVLDLETAMKIEEKDSGLLLEFMEFIKREPRLLDIMKGFQT
jgi:integrase/ribosomal protein L40E